MSALDTHLLVERRLWIKGFDAAPGSSGRAWRLHVKAMKRDPGVALYKRDDWKALFEEHAAGAAADKAWRAPPAKPHDQLDLFGVGLAEFGTRPALNHGEYVDTSTIAAEEHETFEKFDTLRGNAVDLDKNATIKARKAIEAAAAAKELRDQADEAMRRSKGDTNIRIENITDDKWFKKSGRGAGE